MTGLYVHIPFCSVKCHYCDFVTAPADSPLRAGFFGALEAEIRHVRGAFEGTVFDTLYVGGGTPSVLSNGEIERLFETLRRDFRFHPNAEITMEVNPGDAVPLRKFGINRISLGAQTFHDATLKHLNRFNTAAHTVSTFHALREAGFGNISLDLMLSLPGETPADARASLERAVGLGPDHLSLYELVIEEKTHFGAIYLRGAAGARHQSSGGPLPSEQDSQDMLLSARRFLKENGFHQYELLSWCRPGFESRHNLIYWANGEYLGLGPGAWSYWEARRFKRASRVDAYVDKMGRDDFSAEEEETLAGEKKEIESFLLGLRRVDVGAHGRAPLRQAQIADLIGKGLLEEADDRIRLTERGILFAETVFRELC